MKAGFRIAAAMLVLVTSAGSVDLAAQRRGGGQARGQAQGRGQAPRDGLTPREVQAQFDAYVIAQAEDALQISEEQYPQFVRRVRALQMARRETRVRRNRLLAALAQVARTRDVDEGRLATAIRALDDHDRAAPDGIARAYASLDEVLSPWQRARFRVLEDQLEQKKLEMVLRARQGPRR